MILNKQFFFAVATLFGTIVGAGIFAIPFVFAQTGFWLSLFYLCIIAAITLVLHLAYGEVVLRTSERHRLPGYTKLYVGELWRKIIFGIEVLGSAGGLLVYLILGGHFLSLLLGSFFGGTYGMYVFMFWIFFSFAVLRGLKVAGPAEFLLDIFLVGALIALIFVGAPHFSFSNIISFDFAYPFLPYGIFLFALSGAIAIPEMRDVLGKGHLHLFKRAIIVGTLLAFIVSLVFGVAVAGISGVGTTQDALSGLGGILGESFIRLVALFGFLAVSTSFLISGIYLKEVFHLDFGVSKAVSGLLVILIPVFAFGAGLDSFVSIIDFLGSVTVALGSLIVLFAFYVAREKGDRSPEYSIKIPTSIIIVLGALFMAGFIGTVFFNI